MGPEAADQHAALAVTSRRRLLAVLRSELGPMTAAQLAAAVGLHVTTARFHLEVLERAGLVRRAAERAGRPGRPRQLYVADRPAEANDGHRQLAEVLADAVGADPDQGQERAEWAGQLWARRQLPVAVELSWEEGTREVGELFDRLGFAPRLIDDDRGRHLALDSCPFRDLARDHPEVVCTAHAGLLRGALSRLGVASADGARLRPFVKPNLCVADIPRPAAAQEHMP